MYKVVANSIYQIFLDCSPPRHMMKLPHLGPLWLWLVRQREVVYSTSRRERLIAVDGASAALSHAGIGNDREGGCSISLGNCD